jgi:hypothetical protein
MSLSDFRAIWCSLTCSVVRPPSVGVQADSLDRCSQHPELNPALQEAPPSSVPRIPVGAIQAVGNSPAVADRR